MPRSIMDHACNGFGTRMLDLCKSTGLRIVNGRLFNDLHGKFTYVKSNSMSVIDYLVSNQIHFIYLKIFQSGHLMCIVTMFFFFLSFTIKGSFVSDVCEGSQTSFYKWDDKFRNIIRSSLIEKLQFFNNLVTNIDVSSRVSVTHRVNQFSSTITELAKPLFRKEYT